MQMMNWLNERLSFVNSKAFYWVFSGAILLNPIAVWTQAIKAWTVASTEGISGTTFMVMLLLQLLASGYSIRIKEPVMLGAMGTSAVGAVTILLALALR